ncbi:hypothetical protein IAQ61_007942 [Plenodomus lingam]|uniref:Uncharacterized protein n=1 Tax=Leptosphaeria maculans (strain JN3 / isolate v23.1.3 / race Av1-4-5-6-7-8) TaxID=985895 RepID=E4ZZK1_LEPMJ|nr:hypothetical protein LEMA_P102480.1 [Plenodomus lingam JN3]KAH9867350.1 hypothetical protein IAQ61_007942 [Plenodomus lingam]CBX97117.1 hypothetical protein LEMA_P102480.1 [Plenodomus lingam JN3]
MKSLLFLAAALAGLAAASPFTPRAAPDSGRARFMLQVESDTTALANQWVSLESGAISYTLSNSQSQASQFYVTKYDPTGTWSLNAIDNLTHQVALQGPNNVLLYAIQMSSYTIPCGVQMQWATFTKDNGVLGVSDGSSLKDRTFVAVQRNGGTYSVALYDGVSDTKESITPVTLKLVKVEGSGSEK